MGVKGLEVQDSNQEIFNEWLAQDFILNEIEREPDLNERLVKLYDYFKLSSEYYEELEDND